VPGVALVTGAGLWAQARRVAAAPLPHFEDLDPSGHYGDPAGAPVRIDVLGDSSVTGPGLARGSHSWIARLADSLPWSVELRSHARGGSRVRDALIEQAPAATDDPPDLYVVAIGANDVMHATPGPLFRRDLGRLLDSLRQAAPVVSFGVGDLSVIPRLPWTFRTLVSRRSATIDRFHERVSEGRDRVVRLPTRELLDRIFRQDGHDLFVEDEFHPSDAVHKQWAQAFVPHIRAELESITRRAGRSA